MMRLLELMEDDSVRASIELLDDRILYAPTFKSTPDNAEVAVKLLAMAQGAFHCGTDPRLILLDTYGTHLVRLVEEAAFSLGFRKCGEKHLYMLSLDEIPAGAWAEKASAFSYQDIETLGEGAFVDLFREIQPGSIDSFSLGGICDHRNEFAALKKEDRYIPHFWLMAFLADEPIGMILCGSLGKGRQQEGTLQFIGVRPRYRSRSYGTILFRKALLMLKDHGMRKYVDSTACGNLPMLRIFQRHGCKRDCIQYMYRLPIQENHE